MTDRNDLSITGKVHSIQLNDLRDVGGSSLQINADTQDGVQNFFSKAGTPPEIVSAWSLLATTALLSGTSLQFGPGLEPDGRGFYISQVHWLCQIAPPPPAC